MAVNVARPVRLSKKEKEIVDLFVHGEITEKEAAEALGRARQNFPRIISNITRHMVMNHEIDWNKAFKNY